MTPEQLRRLSTKLYGPTAWQPRLAATLGVDGSTVRRWLSGAVPVPEPAAVALRCMAKHQQPTTRKDAKR